MPLSDLTTTNNIVGSTDNTPIGNVGDRLKVDTILNNSLSYRRFAFEDAQLARDTTINPSAFTTVYEYSGSGLLYGFLVNLEGASWAEGQRWYINVLIDNTFNMFGTNGLLFSDMTDSNVYDSFSGTDQFDGINTDGNLFKADFMSFPIYYASNVKIQVKRIISARKFRAGLVKIAKD